jgi:hypothetical protein
MVLVVRAELELIFLITAHCCRYEVLPLGNALSTPNLPLAIYASLPDLKLPTVLLTPCFPNVARLLVLYARGTRKFWRSPGHSIPEHSI